MPGLRRDSIAACSPQLVVHMPEPPGKTSNTIRLYPIWALRVRSRPFGRCGPGTQGVAKRAGVKADHDERLRVCAGFGRLQRQLPGHSGGMNAQLPPVSELDSSEAR